MNKFLRLACSVLIGVGFSYLFVFLRVTDETKYNAFQQPSYFELKSYQGLLLAGAITVLLMLLGSFLSWLKTMDISDDVLPNAVDASEKDISAWVGGSTLDTGNLEAASRPQKEVKHFESVTEILGDNTEMETPVEDERHD